MYFLLTKLDFCFWSTFLWKHVVNDDLPRAQPSTKWSATDNFA